MDAAYSSFAAVVAAFDGRFLVMAGTDVDYARTEQYTESTKARFRAGEGFQWSARLAVQFKVADWETAEYLPRMF